MKHFSRDRNHVYIGAIGGSKAEDTAPKPGIENPVAAIENSVPGIENTNRRVGGARRLSPDTKKDPSCTLAKLESAVHSSLYRSARKNVCAARNGQSRAAFAPKICKTNFLNSLNSNSFVGKDAHFACFYHLKQNFFHSTRNDLPSPAPLPHHKKALLLHKVRLHLSNAKENPQAFPLTLHSVCTTFT